MSTTLKHLREAEYNAAVKLVQTTVVEASKLTRVDTGDAASNIHPVGSRREQAPYRKVEGNIGRGGATSNAKANASKFKPRKDSKFFGVVGTAPHFVYIDEGTASISPSHAITNGFRRAAAKL